MTGRQKRLEPSLVVHFQLINLWERLLNVPISGIGENFFDLGGHSLLLPQMMQEVERLAGRKIPVSEFLKTPTIQNLAHCLLTETTHDGLFVCVQDGAGKIPFYFFHGDILGGGFYSRRLAALLGRDWAVYVSSPLELDENELPMVQELAARKREALQKRQPRGPYVLGGFCVGAVVAYEVARQLAARGEEVRDLVLIEPEIGNFVTRSHQKVVNRIAARHQKTRDKVETFMRGLKKIERLRHVWNAPLREKKEFILQNSKKVLARTSADSNTGFADNSENDSSTPVSDRDWLVPAYHWVLNSYVPKRYRGRMALFLTRQHMEQTPFVLRQWRKVAPQARVVPIPGQHLTCITTHLEAIAAKMRAEIHAMKSLVGVLLPVFGSQAWMWEF